MRSVISQNLLILSSLLFHAVGFVLICAQKIFFSWLLCYVSFWVELSVTYCKNRKVIFDQAALSLDDHVPGTKITFEKALLAVHKSYLKPVTAVMKKVDIRGMAHITGGGLYDNVPRVLPDGLDAVINTENWKPQAIFSFIQEAGNINPEEMFRVFNMGIGYVLIVSLKDVESTLQILKREKQPAKIIGEIKQGTGKTVLL